MLSTHILEIGVTLSGLLNLYLAARSNIWNWLFGIITVCLYLVIYYRVKLYADMSLQLIFLALQFNGLYTWLFGGNDSGKRLTTLTPHYARYLIVGSIPALYFAIAYLLSHYTDSTTIAIDAFTTSLSLVAQWMFNKKWLENWLLWALTMAIATYMCLVKHLYLVSALNATFFIIDIIAYFNWRHEFKNRLTDTHANIINQVPALESI